MTRFFFLLACASFTLTASAQSEYCLDGTVWDAALEGCVPATDCLLDSDLDGDGVVGTGDLLTLLTEFGESVPDGDADGVCDDNDDCVGELDECGVCNGPGPTIEVILDITILYDSVYSDAEGEEGWYVFSVGADTTFTYTCALTDCGGLVSYQGYDYTTVQIGDQCWFAENLRNENYENGDAIPAGLSDSDWQNTTSGAVAVYGEDAGCQHSSPDIDACDPAQSLSEYGRLYNWYAVDDARGLCPSGWHVPTDEEWTAMTDHWGGEMFAGGAMKADYGWYNGGNGTNSSGFSGLPGGTRLPSNGISIGAFFSVGLDGFWWSSSPIGSAGWIRRLRDYNGLVTRSSYVNPQDGFSVRCVRDAE